MRVKLFLLFALVFCVPPSFAQDCITSVRNATVHIPSDASLTLPNGSEIEPGDTLSVHTEEGVCAGYAVWSEEGATFAAAGSFDYDFINENGYDEEDPLLFKVFDVSEDTTVNVGNQVTFENCDLPMCETDVYHDNAFYEITGFDGTPIPVELTDFDVTLDGEQAIVKWRTASETENAGFHVQKKTAKSSWENVKFVEGKGSAGTYRVDYSFGEFDFGKQYFRLVQTDVDGSETVYDPETVFRKPEKNVVAEAPYPNPASARLSLKFVSQKAGRITVEVYDVLGRKARTVFSSRVREAETKSVDVDISDLGSGKYFLVFRTDDGRMTKQFTVVH